MRIPDSVIDEISRRADITEVVGSYVTLRKDGSRLKGLCPFHTEKTPSFKVNPANGTFYCFGCGKGGSVFTFVMEIEKMTFPEAAAHLGEKYGVAVEAEPDDGKAAHRKALIELYARVTGSFSHILRNSASAAPARQYLEGRGFTDTTLSEFQVGYAPRNPGWLASFLGKKGYTHEFLATSGLFSRNYPGRALFYDRIMFPIYSSRGECIAFGGRAMNPEAPKYINSPETELYSKSRQMFGLFQARHEIRRNDTVFVVEGYLDVLAMWQSGLLNSVAPLGTALTETHVQLLRRFAGTVVLVFDSDSAGARATSRAAVLLEKVGIETRVCLLPRGDDPADIMKKSGPDELKKHCTYTINTLEFLVNDAASRTDIASPDGKAFVFDAVFPYINVMDSEVKREGSLTVVADLLGVNPEAVMHDFRKRRRGTSENARESQAKANTKADESNINHDLFLMLATAVNREFFPYVRSRIECADLEDRRSRDVFIALEECFRRQDNSLDRLLERIDEPETRELVLRKSSSDEYSVNAKQLIEDAVKWVRRESLERKQKKVDAQLRRARSDSDGRIEIEKLLQDKIDIDMELKRLKVIAHD